MNLSIKIISILILLSLFVGITINADTSMVSFNGSKNIVYVDDNALSTWYDATHVKTIQEGIDNASSGDTVFVYQGTYYENVIVDKTIDVIGEQRNLTIVNGQSIGSTVLLAASDIVFENFTIIGGGEGCSPDQFAGLRVITNANLIRYNIIKRNNNFGLSINGSNNIITKNWIYGNCGEGIFITPISDNNTLYNNVIQDDAIDYGNNTWNITKTMGTNIVDGPFIAGNYWALYDGLDNDMDGIGDTQIPYNASGNIVNGGDFLPLLDTIRVNQSVFDRGFPIRHAADGDWGAAQSFDQNTQFLSRICLYVRKFGTPNSNFTVELRKDSVNGNLSRTIVFEPDQISSDWQWLSVDFGDFIIADETINYIVIPPPPEGVTTSFGYEWGYAFGDQYPGGSFWFTRDGGGLWRDLPTMYEFCFQTYGYN